jgi:hypothetical protein
MPETAQAPQAVSGAPDLLALSSTSTYELAIDSIAFEIKIIEERRPVSKYLKRRI